MKRPISLLVILAFTGCTGSSPPRSEDVSTDAKDDGIVAAKISAKLSPLLAFLRDDKNLVAQLGPEGTDAQNVRKRIKVVPYTEFGRAVDVAAQAIARNYQVAVGSKYRRATGLVDLLSVGDMYVQVKAGYGDDSFVDKLVTAPKRAQARELATTLLPEAALLSADQASTVSTGNYVLVLGDMGSAQAIVMTVEYEVY